jgi:hypothetical protein
MSERRRSSRACGDDGARALAPSCDLSCPRWRRDGWSLELASAATVELSHMVENLAPDSPCSSSPPVPRPSRGRPPAFAAVQRVSECLDQAPTSGGPLLPFHVLSLPSGAREQLHASSGAQGDGSCRQRRRPPLHAPAPRPPPSAGAWKAERSPPRRGAPRRAFRVAASRTKGVFLIDTEKGTGSAGTHGRVGGRG